MSFFVTVNGAIDCWSHDAAAAILLAETRKLQSPAARVVVGYGDEDDLAVDDDTTELHPVMVVN